MTDTLAILGYLDDWYLFRQRVMNQIHTLWRLYALIVVFMWAFLPWREGWQGVGLATWTTFWCAYARAGLWFANWKVRTG